jgi:hypothetical protein
VTVRVEVAFALAGGVTEVGFKLHATVGSVGETLQARLTRELKLLTEFMVMVEVAGLPGSTLCEAGFVLIPKSGSERVILYSMLEKLLRLFAASVARTR